MAWVLPAIEIAGTLFSAYMQSKKSQDTKKEGSASFGDFMGDVNNARSGQYHSNIGFNNSPGNPQAQGGGLNFNAQGGAGTGNAGLSQAALQYFQNMRNQPMSGTLGNSPSAFGTNPYLQQTNPYLQQSGNTSFASLAQQNNNLRFPGYNPGLQQLNQRRY